MAFFNPHKVDFNYDTRMIDAVGAVGRSLYEIYKDNVAKNQNQARLDETNRANLMKEYLYGQKNQETARHNQAAEAETAKKNAFDQDLSLKNFYSTDSLRRAQINNLYADNARQNAQLQWNMNQARDKAQAEQEKQAGIDMAWYNAGQQGGQFGELPQGLSDAEKRNLGRQYRLQTEAQGGINKAQEPILKQQEAQRKEEQTAKINDFLFNQMGGQIPQGMTDPREQAAYKAAYVSPEATKARAASAGSPEKNLPVGIANKLMHSREILDQYAPYANDLVGNESKISGPVDNITAPAARGLGLNADITADLYAKADAIADLERAYTKGGGLMTKKAVYDQIQPVNVFFNTTLAGVAARASNHLASIKEAEKFLISQGNYKGAEYFSNMYNDYLGQFPKEIRDKIDKTTVGKEQQMLKRLNKMAPPMNTASSGGYAPQNLYDEMSAYDENGVRYVGDDGFNSW